MGGAYNLVAPGQEIAGRMVGAGSTLGHGLPLLASGNHYISLNLAPAQEGEAIRYRSTYLAAPPLVFPLGTSYSQVQVTFRAIPYCPLYFYQSGGSQSFPGAISINRNWIYYPRGGFQSSGIILWDNTHDTELEVQGPLL